MKDITSPDQNPEEVAISTQEENPRENAPEVTEVTETVAAEETLTEIALAEVAAETEVVAETEAVEEVAVEDEEAVALPEAEVTEEPEETRGTQEVRAEEPSEAPEAAETKSEMQPETVAGVSEPAEAPAPLVSEELKLVEETLMQHEGEDADEEEAEAVAETEVEAVADLSLLSRLQLVERLEETVRNSDVNAIRNTVSLLKVAYLARTKEEHHAMYQQATADEEAQNFEVSDPVDDRYKAAFAIYRQNKVKYGEELELEKQRNLEIKKHILEELKTLIASEETLKKTYDDFKSLQEKWRATGMVSKSEAQGLWQNYHFLIEKFFDKVKINKELKDLDLRKNLERKIELCEKVEELILENSMARAFKRLQELHDEWKEIGPVSQDKREEVWDRFKMATEKINERRRDFYGKVQEEQSANYAAKLLLVEQLEQLVSQEYNSIKQWQDSTQKINDLLNTWKSVGPASQKVNNEVWNRFKSQLDTYFANKKEYFGKLKEQQLHNYNLKVDLCVQAESHNLSTDWKNSSRELIRLQEEWKKIGPVPRKHSDKIWKRFRLACDEFFHRKGEFFKNVQASEGENLQIKKDILEKLVNFEFGDNRQANFDLVKDLQRQWMETGHVPIKEKDKLQADYKAALNKIYDKLKIDSAEQYAMNYKNRLENIREQPDAVRIINRERTTLQSKIDELKEEILLWENNIGFFARSKQASVLKAEFEAKIAKAKEEVSKMEAKMKFLRNAAREQEQNKQ